MFNASFAGLKSRQILTNQKVLETPQAVDANPTLSPSPVGRRGGGAAQRAEPVHQHAAGGGPGLGPRVQPLP